MPHRFEPSLLDATTSRINALGHITSTPGSLTRLSFTPAMREAMMLLRSWMINAGLDVREDALGNLIGRRAARVPNARTLVIGSHLDTVCDAGKFDGALGILMGLGTLEHLHRHGITLPYHVELVAFSDEEGARFHTAYLGSAWFAGHFPDEWLARCDVAGVSLSQALMEWGTSASELLAPPPPRPDLIGYVEAHIEQGPVLEKQDVALGVVTAIAGQTRVSVMFTGRAGHAGTTPMDLRHDALTGAAEFILLVEHTARQTPGLVATVGVIEAQPGASNVIPGVVRVSLDVRHAVDAERERALSVLYTAAGALASSRGLLCEWSVVQSSQAVTCSPVLRDFLAEAVTRIQGVAPQLVSGAGHDAVALSNSMPVAMLFVRCRDGLSHHPDEFAERNDIAKGMAALVEFLRSLPG